MQKKGTEHASPFGTRGNAIEIHQIAPRRRRSWGRFLNLLRRVRAPQTACFEPFARMRSLAALQLHHGGDGWKHRRDRHPLE